MSKGHLCNSFFEGEFEQKENSIEALWDSSPISLQLQFLPLLYKEPGDHIFVSALPEIGEESFSLISSPTPTLSLESWGPSPLVKKWAKTAEIPYEIPPPSLIEEINSKAFSFSQGVKLKGAELLKSAKEAFSWLQSFEGPKVLKTAFGLSGTGHLFSQNLSPSTLEKLFAKHPLCIGEPWVDRLVDFSTQWFLEKGKVHYLGATLIENTLRGCYLATSFPFPEKFSWALKEHLEYVKPVLQTIEKKGYFGNVGIDAFVYREGKGEKLHPLVEINGRKTMSWLALQMKASFPFRLSYKKAEYGLLPSRVQRKGRWISFDRNLTIELCRNLL